jgi:hypothetical protein
MMKIAIQPIKFGIVLLQIAKTYLLVKSEEVFSHMVLNSKRMVFAGARI